MSTWIIISWVLVGLLTGLNIFIFLKFKQMATQMMKSAFPGAKNMNQMQDQMEKMMKMMGNMGSMGGLAGLAGQSNLSKDQQLKAAMDMIKKMKK